jgi:hypothetical protein
MSQKQAIEVLKFTRAMTDKLYQDFPEGKLTHQPSPTDNHALWVLGHLAITDAWYCGMVGASGASMPDGYEALFGMGSKPVSDASKYPKLSEVRKVYEANRAAMLDWLQKASATELGASLAEKTGGFMSDPLDGALKLSWHEGWHGGQVASVRKALGLASIFG